MDEYIKYRYNMIVDELELYDDYVSDDLKNAMNELYKHLESCSWEDRNAFAERLYYLIDKEKKYTAIWLYSSCIAIGDSNAIFEEFLLYVLECDRITPNTRYYLYYQLKSRMFRQLEYETKRAKVLKWKLLDKIVSEFRRLLEDDLYFVPASMRDEKFAVVIIEQLLYATHGPSKIALDRCKVLMEKFGMRVLLINTAEIISQRGSVPFFANVSGSYVTEFLEQESMQWKGVTIPYFQCDDNMPNVTDMHALIQMIHNTRPGLVVSIGGSSILANLINDIVPVLVVGLTPSDMESTMVTCQTLSRPLTLEDKGILREVGIEEKQIINSIFTSSLQEQKRYVSRAEMGLPEDKFVVGVVGYRLDTDVGPDFIELLKSIICEELCIAFVGRYEKYDDLVRENPELKECTRKLGLTDDILAWIDNCDLYLNPRRKGGGTSGVEALFKGVPVITIPYGDVATNVGSDFWVDSYEQIPGLVERYMYDKEYYYMMSEKAKERAAVLLDSENEFMRVIEEFKRRTTDER